MLLEGVNARPDMLMLRMPIYMGIVLVISWTKILLRVMVKVINVWTLVEMSGSRSYDIIVKREKA